MCSEFSRGQGGVVLLEGRHGMGRTRLLSVEKLLKDFSIPYNFCNSRSPQQPMYDTFQGLFNEFSNSDRTSVLVRENINRDDSWEIYSMLLNPFGRTAMSPHRYRTADEVPCDC